MLHNMNTTGIYNKNAERSARIRTAKSGAVYALCALFVLFFFLPLVSYTVNGQTYTLTGLNILFSKIHIEGFYVGMPLLSKTGVAAGILLAIAGSLLLLLKKPMAAGGAWMAAALCPLLLLMTGSAVPMALAGAGIPEVTVSYHTVLLLALLCGLAAAVCAVWTKGGEKLAEAIFLVFACVSVGSVVLITAYMLVSGVPAIAEIGLADFLLGSEWAPGRGQFGIRNMILASLGGMGGAILLGVPVGLLTAVCLPETAKPRVSRLVRPAVELLAGIPSVIFGFFGMLVIVPALRALFPDHTIGESLLAVILILAIMILPTIVSVSETVLRAVPAGYREASLALGCTPVRTIFRVTIPAAKSGILSGVILGVGRAVGETMAVIMVAGNMVNTPSLLGTVRPLTSGIVLEMSYASGLHRQALFAIGLVLFAFILMINITFTILSRRGGKTYAE